MSNDFSSRYKALSDSLDARLRGSGLSANEYQTRAMRTSDPLLTLERALLNGALGLCGEAGEVSELVKKHAFHHKGFDIEDLKLELGDVLWYVALLCQVTNLKMEDVMAANLTKLEKRYAKV